MMYDMHKPLNWQHVRRHITSKHRLKRWCWKLFTFLISFLIISFQIIFISNLVSLFLLLFFFVLNSFFLYFFQFHYLIFYWFRILLSYFLRFAFYGITFQLKFSNILNLFYFKIFLLCFWIVLICWCQK